MWKAPAVPGLYPLKFLYNIVQVMLCSYMCIEAGWQAYKNGYTLIPCNPFNEVNPPIGAILYVFYISKVLDFMDTFFIIAEKRWAQLSFLHVYHHTSIFLVSRYYHYCLLLIVALTYNVCLVLLAYIHNCNVEEEDQMNI